jgi:hypothetical protein
MRVLHSETLMSKIAEGLSRSITKQHAVRLWRRIRNVPELDDLFSDVDGKHALDTTIILGDCTIPQRALNRTAVDRGANKDMGQMAGSTVNRVGKGSVLETWRQPGRCCP